MNMRIFLPFHVFAELTDVLRIVAETRQGSFGLLPHRLDCVAALSPGILTYETREKGTVYLAVDEGVLVKAGPNVLISVRHAIAGADLGQLHETVKRQFLTIDQQERDVRLVVAKMESGLLARLAEFQHER
jgi:F-type H+-transporting ATPase subunit epsilon